MKGGQYVIVARKEAADAPFAILSRDVRYLLKKGDYLKQPLSQEHVEQNKKSLDMQ